MEPFELKDVEIKGRTATFAIVSGNFSVNSRIVMSSKLIEFVNKLELREKIATESERVEIQFSLVRRFLGDRSYDAVQDYLEEESESVEEDFEALGKILGMIYEDVIPKLRASVEKGSRGR